LEGERCHVLKDCQSELCAQLARKFKKVQAKKTRQNEMNQFDGIFWEYIPLHV